MKLQVQSTILASIFGIGITPLSAEWREEIGFTRLQLLAGSELPAAPSQGFSQVEADLDSNFAPDTASVLFSGKTFTNKSGTSGASSHATHVATNFYGNTSSLVTGNCPIDLYSAGSWLGANFLNLGTSSEPVKEYRTVQNHSWVGSVEPSASDAEASRRLDYAINRDGFVCVVGSDNNAATILPQLLCQSYHTISVGRDDGGHSAGLTTLDGTGRIKPDLVAPSAAPEYATSWTTPMVSSAAGLLYAKLAAAPYSLPPVDRVRVIKALLLATATKNTLPSWTNTSSRPLDLRYGAGELNIHHAYHALRAGKATASNITLRNPRGWAAESVSGNSTKTYFFTIAAGAPSTPFSAALTWHRVITDNLIGPYSWGNLSSTLANLNLRLYHANAFTVGSLVAESLSSVDNVELVYQSALPPGTYALVVQNTSTTNTPYALAWHSLPAVTVAATTPTAQEIDLQAGLVTISRTGDTALPLFVPITVGGNAVGGSHFQPLPASVTIPAGQPSATLKITPIADTNAQGGRSVTVAVAADFALVRDTAQTAAVTILDKPYDAWRFANFSGPELENPAISGETADPDNDHLANLVEYALALAPKTSSVTTITAVQSGGYLTLTAAKNAAATDLLWDAEATGDLISWQPAVITTNHESAFVARDSILAVSAAKHFLRLKITRP